MRVRDLIKELLNCDMDAHVLIHIENGKTTYIANEVKQVLKGTGKPYDSLAIIISEFNENNPY